MINKVNSQNLKWAGIFALLLVMIAIAALGIVILCNIHSIFPGYGIETALAIVVIVGTLVLLSTLTVVAVVFSGLSMGDRNQALGLPEGSVRAIIALSLIIIFVIMAVFMFQGIGPSFIELKNGTQYWNETSFINITAPAYIPREPTQEQINIAQNIMTTVGTLVVALAGFYFGTRAVQVAKGEAPKATLTITSPDKDPYPMNPAKGTTLEITVKTTPEDESVDWESPDGDPKGSLVQIEPKKFRYTRGKDPKDTVTLKFSLTRDPSVKAELKVVKQKTTP